MAPITSLSDLILELGCVSEFERAILMVRLFHRRCCGSSLAGAVGIKLAKAFPATQVTQKAAVMIIRKAFINKGSMFANLYRRCRFGLRPQDRQNRRPEAR